METIQEAMRELMRRKKDQKINTASSPLQINESRKLYHGDNDRELQAGDELTVNNTHEKVIVTSISRYGNAVHVRKEGEDKERIYPSFAFADNLKWLDKEAEQRKKTQISLQEKIKKFFKGDSRYFDKAADIIVEWYEIENNIEMLRRPTLDDILDLLNASSYEKESVIIAKAIGPKAKFAFPTFNGKDISEYGDEYLTEDLEQAKNESLLPDL